MVSLLTHGTSNHLLLVVKMPVARLVNDGTAPLGHNRARQAVKVLFVLMRV